MAGRRVGTNPAYQEARLDRRHPLARGLSGLWLLNEGGGTGVLNLVAGTRYSAAWGGDATRATTRRGLGVGTSTSGSVAAVDLVANASAILPTQGVTILLGYRKRDGSNRASGGFGLNGPGGGSTDLCGAHLPYSDGTVYWDFGGGTAGSTRVTASGLTFGNDLWAFTTGARGMEIWQNGVPRASNGANPTRTAGVSPFSLGVHAGTGYDFAEWWYVAVYTRQLAPGEIANLTADPYALLLPRRRVFKAGAAPTYTATAAPALPVMTASGAGTFSAPVYTATAAIALPKLAAVGTGTFTAPVYTGTAAPVLPALTASGTGTFAAPVYTGSAAVSLPALTAAGVGDSTAPTYTGSAAVTLPALTGTGSGTSTAPVYSGNAAVSLAALTGAGSGTFTAPAYTGSAAPSLPALTVAGVGTFVAPTYTGSAALALPHLTGAGSGAFAAEVYQGTAALALPALTATATGTFVAPPITGTAALALPAFSATGVGTFAVPGRVTLSATVVGGATVGAARVGGGLTITTEE